MRTSSDLLWKLIGSMSSREKLYFRRNFTDPRHAEKSLYLRLFDAIAAQKVYDEPAIIRKFSPGLTRKNMAAQKHYLYAQLCDALLSYDSRDDHSHEIYRSLQLIRVLRKKGLLDEAHSLWEKTVSRARSSESFALLNMLKAEFGKMILFSGNQTPHEELHKIFKGHVISYQVYMELMNLRDMYTEVLLLKRKAHYDIDEPLKKRMEELLERVEQSEERFPAHSFWFLHYLRMTKATLLYLLNDVPQSLQLLSRVWENWKSNPHYLQSESEYYIEVLYMINYAGVLHGDFTYVEKIFNDPLNDRIGNAQRANFEAVKFIALNKIYNKTARYAEVETLVNFVKPKFKEWETVLNSDMNRTLVLSVGIASFVLEQYGDAFYFIKRGLTDFRDGAREEHAAVGQLLLLLTAYCMNNQRLFDSQYRSTYQYFYKRQKKRPFETALLQCLQRCFYMTDNREKISCYRQTLESLEKTSTDKIQQMAFNIFNFPGWLAAMTQRISYRKYVQKAVKDRSAA
jgi:hypothetical protein